LLNRVPLTVLIIRSGIKSNNNYAKWHTEAPVTHLKLRPASTLTIDIATTSVQQLVTLSAEVLCLHLAAWNLHTLGSKAVLAFMTHFTFLPQGLPSTMLAAQQSTSLNVSNTPSQQPISTGASTTPTLHTHPTYVTTHSPIVSSSASSTTLN